jgi:hypothetical protein
VCWTFFDYLDGGGGSVIAAWLHSLPIKAQAKIDSRLLTMARMQDWPEGWVSSYQGYVSILELRIIHASIQYRPLGCYGPRARQFTLLAGAIEKGDRISTSVLRSAVERRDIILGDRQRVCEHQFN